MDVEPVVWDPASTTGAAPSKRPLADKHVVVILKTRDRLPSAKGENQMFRCSEEWASSSLYDDAEHSCPPDARRRNDVGRRMTHQIGDGPQGVTRNDLLHRLCGFIRHEDGRSSWVAEPVASGRRDTEDLRSRTVVRHGFLLDWINVSRDHASVDVEPQLALVHPADPA